ncbi:MAG: sarcosine oxidase subunit gamma family protein [Nesterenkonia sp.]|nr:sarcosine oxidase subunit gamma family protein [Nesterenkonia sp.]
MTADQTTADQASAPPADLRRSPAAHLTEQMRAGDVDGPRGVRLREIPFAVQLGIRAEPGAPSGRAAAEAWGVGLPAGPRAGETVTGDPEGRHVIWISPDEFLAVEPSGLAGLIDVSGIEGALEGMPGQIVDLSGNRTILELTGPSARSVLEKGCHVDLHPRAFPVGAAASTLLGPVQAIVHRTREDVFRILPRASFADYTVRWLLDGMAEFAGEELIR